MLLYYKLYFILPTVAITWADAKKLQIIFPGLTRAPLKSVMSDQSARQAERRNRSEHGVHDGFRAPTNAAIWARNRFLEVPARSRRNSRYAITLVKQTVAMNYSYNGKTTVQKPDQAPTLANAYRYCRQITRHHAKTFYLATLFLAKKQRNPIYAMYALLRTVDDLVDLAEDKLTNGLLKRDELSAMMNDWKTRLDQCYQGDHNNDPIMTAWQNTLESHRIPIELPLDLMDGVAMDIDFKPFETFDDLSVYCYKVASVVGLMCLEIFGYRDKKAIDHAVELGIAMQLTNILRDIGEDVDRGRIYLPLEDLDRFGYTQEEFMQKKMNNNFVELIRFQIARARQYYESAEKGIPMLEKNSRLAVTISSRNYNNILTAIEENNYNVFSYRAYRSFYQKIKTIPSIWYSMKAPRYQQEKIGAGNEHY